jgi:hypothetical protein
MSIVRPLVISKIYGVKCYYIPNLEVYFKGVKSVKIDFDEDHEGKFIKVRPYADIDVSKHVLADLL